MKHDVRGKALEALVGDVRRQQPAHVDWDAAESDLLARVAQGDAVPRSRTRAARAPWLVLAAAAAVAAISIGALATRGGTRGAASNATTESTVVASKDVDGDALSVGASLVASAEPLVVVHREHVVWTLAAGSVAHLEAVGDVIAVALDRGSLEAKVTKSPRSESFAVRVERTRIAVHGTAFRVERRDGTTHISVNEGVVGVGPIGKASFDLPAPGSAVVTFDGVRTDALGLGAEGEPRETRITHEGSATALKERGKTPTGTREEAPRDANAEVDRLVGAVRACFGEHSVSRGDLRVTVSTHLSLRVAPDGRVSEARFSPPLVPAVQTCVEKTIRELTFPRSAESVTVERVLELEH